MIHTGLFLLPFYRTLARSEKKTAASRVWSRVIHPISFWYAKCTFLKVMKHYFFFFFWIFIYFWCFFVKRDLVFLDIPTQIRPLERDLVFKYIWKNQKFWIIFVSVSLQFISRDWSSLSSCRYLLWFVVSF